MSLENRHFIFLGVFLAALWISLPGPLPGASRGWLGVPPLLAEDSPGSGPGQAPEGNSRDKGYEGVEKELKKLKEELERLQNEASQKFRSEVLPYLQKEIERLNKWLREFHLDKKRQPETRET